MSRPASAGLLADARHVVRYLGYVARHFSAFFLVLALTLITLLVEYAATSLMIPMAPGIAQRDSAVTAFWTHVAAGLGLDPVPRTWLWLFVLLLLLRLSLGYVLAVMSTWLGKRVHRALSGRVFAHVVGKEPMAQVYTRSVGHYITIAGDDTFRSGTILASLLQAGVGLATALVALAVLWQFSPEFFAWVTSFLVLSLLAVSLMMNRVLSINVRANELSRELGTTFVEALNSLRSIRALHAERFVIETYAGQILRYVRMLVLIDAIRAAARTLPAVCLLLIAVVLLRPSGSVDMSDAALIAGTVIVIRVFAALGQVVTAGAQAFTDIRAIKDIDALIAGSVVATAERDSLYPLVEIRSLDLRDIDFGYGERGAVLSGLNIRLEAGRTYAVVGPSGAGKSTLADLLLGLSVPDRGTLLVNEGTTSLADARRGFALVEQQPKIFSSSLRDNLLLGAQASDAELYAALEAVSLSETVRALPDGLDTRVSYLGENFSGGQRQRLGIARALVRNPQVLILDEATSALDRETRVALVSQLRRRMADRIIVFITHDAEIEGIADVVLRIDSAVGSADPSADTDLSVIPPNTGAGDRAFTRPSGPHQGGV